ncbi:unnamed protein product [Diatraea saccharalis]|uniref:Uncharacterized protein n=1 Tax=Diatraea saccharalis TaxID=40085 RepID=A0A9N9QWH0_9NEOP|nr:unnamed protein product [Diatraea saccharalis]
MAAAWVISFALAAASLVQAQNPQCQTEMIGQITGNPLPLQPVPLLPPSSTWDITIPSVCVNAGLLVKVCDPDGPPLPTVTPLNNREIIVKRNANPLLQPAMVYVTVFCTESHRSNNYNVQPTVLAVPKL